MCRSGEREELMRGTFYYAFAVATFVLLFWTAPVNVVVFASLFIGDGIADPIGRLSTAWASASRTAAADKLTDDGKTATAPAAAAEAPCDGKTGKPLVWLQYRVGWFGVKSYPGSLAFFGSALGAAALWGKLFSWAGHYGPDFDMRSFMVRVQQQYTTVVSVPPAPRAHSPCSITSEIRASPRLAGRRIAMHRRSDRGRGRLATACRQPACHVRCGSGSLLPRREWRGAVHAADLRLTRQHEQQGRLCLYGATGERARWRVRDETHARNETRPTISTVPSGIAGERAGSLSSVPGGLVWNPDQRPRRPTSKTHHGSEAHCSSAPARCSRVQDAPARHRRTAKGGSE